MIGAPQFPGSNYRRRDTVLVWAVWLIMSAAALYFVFTYCSDVPYGEEWLCVPQMTGARPVTCAFLWEQVTDHHMPLNKLVFVLLGRWSHGELRVEKTLNVTLMAAIAAFLIVAARRMRGRTHWADAFFPLALLHWGHWEVFLMAFLFQFIVSTGLAVVCLAIIVRQQLPSARQSLLAAICLVCLPFAGANGLIFVPPLALWLAVVGVMRWRLAANVRERQRVALLFAMIGIAAALCLANVMAYHKPVTQPPSLGRRAILQTCLQFLGMSWGSAGMFEWPGAAWAAATLVAVTLGRIAWLWWKKPDERFRLAGLLLFFVAMAVMTFAVGKGRSSFGFLAGFAPRYSLLALPILIAAFFTWAIHPPRVGRMMEIGLCMAMVVMLHFDFVDAIPHAIERRDDVALFKMELKRGQSSQRLAEHHRFTLYPLVDLTAPGLEMMRQARVGPFRNQPTPESARTETAWAAGR